MPKITPLANRMRPARLDEIIGQSHILAPGALLYRMIQADQLYSIILYGPPGTGKTTIANVIANTTNKDFHQINATTAGKADMRKVTDDAIELWHTENRGTILFIDEIHRFNKAQQDYLLPFVENGTIVLIGATTENPYFEVNGALLSRSRIFELKPLTEDEIYVAIERTLKNTQNGYGTKSVLMSKDTIRHLAHIVDGDIRQALNALELAVETTAPDERDVIVITDGIVSSCTQKKIMRFDKNGDNHYDFISAYIESMKHSDVDASLYYLARMLSAGEDPKYIARRLIVDASCDIGLANPQAFLIAIAAFLAVERVGMPECTSALAMSTIYNATSPKSNSASKALAGAMQDVDVTGNLPVPSFLQDESYKSASKLGRGGVSDVFSHKCPYNFDPYFDGMPPELKDHKYFFTQGMGYETEIKKYLDWCEDYRQKVEPQNGESKHD
ncbi:MAG: replication-associated recombination protein A [Clostridia bacterium]|nr:replication-associated recombination protein A [Clostridia bacterium]